MSPSAIALAFLFAAADEPAAVQPDVAIFATVRARELRFDEVPTVDVRFRGSGETVSNTQRDGLPDEVQPRVLYRDIGIRLTITSTLPNIETILEDALQEERP